MRLKFILALMVAAATVNAQTNDSLQAADVSKSAAFQKAAFFVEFGIPVSYFDKAKAPSNDPSITDAYKKASRASLSFGFRFQKYLSPNTYFVSGLSYAERGAGYKYENESVTVTTTNSYGIKSTGNGENYLRYRLSYFEIPVNMGAILAKGKKGPDFGVIGGVTAMFNATSKVRASYFDGASNDLKEKWSQTDLEISKKVLAALNLGIQIGKLREGNLDRGYVFIMFQAPFGTVYDAKGGYERFDAKMRSFTFGMAFSLRKK